MELIQIGARLSVVIVVTYVLCNILDVYGEVIISHAAKRSNLIDKVMHDRVLWFIVTKNKYTCLAECARDEQCNSFFYRKPTGQCQGHSLTFGTTDGSFDIPDARYYVLQRGEAYVGDACVNVTDCVTGNTECRDGRCLCLPGYSFSPRTRECLNGCLAYGPDFLEFRDFYISAQNNEIRLNVSLPDCFALCRNRTDYTCLSLEYGRTSTKCYLANITQMHMPNQWNEDVVKEYNISYYQRDCS